MTRHVLPLIAGMLLAVVLVPLFGVEILLKVVGSIALLLAAALYAVKLGWTR